MMHVAEVAATHSMHANIGLIAELSGRAVYRIHQAVAADQKLSILSRTADQVTGAHCWAGEQIQTVSSQSHGSLGHHITGRNAGH